MAAPRRGLLRRARRLPRRGRPQGAARACSPSAFGGVPAYVMPNTSGLNARVRPPSSPSTSAPPPDLADDSLRVRDQSRTQRRDQSVISARRFSMVVNASWNDSANDVDAFALEGRGDVVEVDAGVGEVAS